jgi:nucleoside-diphosphate-sugar epimerase
MTLTRKILLLGGTGPIGNQLVKILKNADFQITVTSRTKSTINDNVIYVKGDALQIKFVLSLLELQDWDVIIDFMNYKTFAFQQSYKYLLSNTCHYIFTSSARVYADSGLYQIAEESPRLLDTISNPDYLQSDEYALAKAKQENLLFESSYDNWTVIRPYITFDTYRLQLAIFEKEQWLYRVLNNKTLILPSSIMQRRTTLTYALDVAMAISVLIKCKIGLKEVFNVCSVHDFSWSNIYDIYMSVIQQSLCFHPRTIFVDDDFLPKICPSIDQYEYDRKFHRRFNSEKVINATGISLSTDVALQLRQSLSDFLTDPVLNNLNIKNEATLDFIANDNWNPLDFNSKKTLIRYLYHRIKRSARRAS